MIHHTDDWLTIHGGDARAILIDLNPAYLEQQMRRNAQVPVGL